MRVGLIGCGAIGTIVARHLLEGGVTGCSLSGILARHELPSELVGAKPMSLDRLLRASDLIVEAAGHDALKEAGPIVTGAGRDLLVMSVGALADKRLFHLVSGGRGRLLISTGAIGGIDTLVAAGLMEPLRSVRLTSKKPASVLVRAWMDQEMRDALVDARRPEVEAFRGSAREASLLFPESANISALLALATIGFDDVEVRIIGTRTTEVQHRVEAHGEAGSYDFIFRNRPSNINPKTSGITAYAVLRALGNRESAVLVGV